MYVKGILLVCIFILCFLLEIPAGDFLLQPVRLAWLLQFLPFSSFLPTAGVSACTCYSLLLGLPLGYTFPEVALGHLSADRLYSLHF